MSKTRQRSIKLLQFFSKCSWFRSQNFRQCWMAALRCFYQVAGKSWMERKHYNLAIRWKLHFTVPKSARKYHKTWWARFLRSRCQCPRNVWILRTDYFLEDSTESDETMHSWKQYVYHNSVSTYIRSHKHTKSHLLTHYCYVHVYMNAIKLFSLWSASQFTCTYALQIIAFTEAQMAMRLSSPLFDVSVIFWMLINKSN